MSKKIAVWADLNNTEADQFTHGMIKEDVTDITQYAVNYLSLLKWGGAWQPVNKQLQENADLILYNYEVRQCVTVFKQLKEMGFI